jgi:DNA polymerase III sliding clamp (beta) subunit (PCNA family)
MKLTANRDTVATILDRCRRIADARSTMPILANVDDGKITISTESPESGEGCDDVVADCDLHAIVGVSARYLLDVCAAMACDEIAIGVSGELDPLTVVPATAEDSWESGHVVMPCRI